MRQMFPNACYIGFTGTPLLKKEKNNFVKFGNLIDPHYPISAAVEDGAVVPRCYSRPGMSKCGRTRRPSTYGLTGTRRG